MVCPVCGEALELEGYEVGDLVDCEACGAVLRLLSDGGLEVVVPPRIVYRGAPARRECTLPSVSVYECPFREALALLRPVVG